MIIFKKFSFESAHFLPNVPDDHKCKQVHGHTYRLTLFVEGGLDAGLNWVMDFADLKEVAAPVIKQIDHKLLNDVDGLDNPTCEAIAVWIWDRIKPGIPNLVKIELNETLTSGVVYQG